MKNPSKKDPKHNYIYICESPILTGYKIGYHRGLPVDLYRRYQTPFTNKVSFTLFPTEFPIKQEKVLHRILNPYRISNEVFQKTPELFNLYCYMAKCITNCQRIQCYSREKYGFPRYKGLWNYQKLETEEENKINDAVNLIWKTGNIPGEDDQDMLSKDTTGEDVSREDDQDMLSEDTSGEDVSENLSKLNIEDISENLSKLNIEDISDKEEEDPFMSQEEIDQKYADNPFRKYAYRGPKKNWYDRKNIST